MPGWLTRRQPCVVCPQVTAGHRVPHVSPCYRAGAGGAVGSAREQAPGTPPPPPPMRTTPLRCSTPTHSGAGRLWRHQAALWPADLLQLVPAPAQACVWTGPRLAVGLWDRGGGGRKGGEVWRVAVVCAKGRGARWRIGGLGTAVCVPAGTLMEAAAHCRFGMQAYAGYAPTTFRCGRRW